MNREDIIRLAREAGFSDHSSPEMWGVMVASHEEIERFAELVAAAVLAEPEPEPEPEPYPVAWMEAPHGAIRANPLYRIYLPPSLLAWSIPLYTHPPKARDWAAAAIRERGESK
jgi:hypothetical protein